MYQSINFKVKFINNKTTNRKLMLKSSDRLLLSYGLRTKKYVLIFVKISLNCRVKHA